MTSSNTLFAINCNCDNSCCYTGQTCNETANLEELILLVLALVLGLHIYNIVLLQIVAGGSEDILAAYVMHINLTLAVHLADYSYMVHLGICAQLLYPADVDVYNDSDLCGTQRYQQGQRM